MAKTVTARQYAAAAGLAGTLTKFYCGIANNAAWPVVLEAMDHARLSRRFKGEAKQAFNRCMAAWRAYEVGLVYGGRSFHMASLPADMRKRYGNITDREYYEFWCATGGVMYEKTRPLITSLANKYRLPLERQKMEDAEHIAWLLAARAALSVAWNIFDNNLSECAKKSDISVRLLHKAVAAYDISKVLRAWERAVLHFSGATTIEVSDLEDKNIRHGLVQLCEAWTDIDNIIHAYLQTAEDYPEVWRTKGEMQKALREISEIAK